ncbi:hypothetical protein LJB94_03100 [Odoribacter sp. OttesenSCG-928-G04]|nr:hypothetical protein [Odoribacter sp. OttesenSCG-928-G04]MDL2331219.1 hypothetical protein [Odoribacter sp. OttesenSCG-928-A06]
MNYNTLRTTIIARFGELNSSMIDYLFEQAVEFANKGQLDEASAICRDTLVFSKYSKVGYRIIYLLGLLCTIYINNDQPEMAESIFTTGMMFIQDSKDAGVAPGSFTDDINSFLDLKIEINKALGKE